MEHVGILTRTIFAFGSPADSSNGHLVLNAGGTVSGQNQSNEARWKLQNGQLLFLNTDGVETSRLSPQGTCWLGERSNSKWPLFLVPLLTINTSGSDCRFPPVFVNSIPKSGTYLLDVLLARLGWRPSRLHVWGSNGVDDYRGLSDSEMHSNPLRQTLNCPFECLGAILSPGDLIVGHVDKRDAVHRLTCGGATELLLRRNLRDALYSLYRFKLRKVEPRTPADKAWRTIAEPERFLGFLSYFGTNDIEFLKQIAESHLSADGISLSFEDLVNQSLPASFKNWLEFIEAGLSVRCVSILRSVLDTETSTFSGARSNWRDLWDDRVELFFEKSGLKDINARLGYEETSNRYSNREIAEIKCDMRRREAALEVNAGNPTAQTQPPDQALLLEENRQLRSRLADETRRHLEARDATAKVFGEQAAAQAALAELKVLYEAALDAAARAEAHAAHAIAKAEAEAAGIKAQADAQTASFLAKSEAETAIIRDALSQARSREAALAETLHSVLNSRTWKMMASYRSLAERLRGKKARQ